MNRVVVLLAMMLAMLACKPSIEPADSGTRSYRMGFSAMPPRLELPLVLRTIEEFAPRADAALLSTSPPWKTLLAGTPAATIVTQDPLPLAGLFRAKGLPIVAMVDVTDGLARDREAPELVAMGRSITEPAVQAAYRSYVLALDSLVRPEYLGLAMETNMVRAGAPRPVYDAIRVMTNEVAQQLRARGSRAKLFVSVQVETAWGRLPATGRFEGIADDRRDFPFIRALGLSSYPYLGGFNEPEDVPLDYYSRVASDTATPALVVEGGWTSVGVAGFAGAVASSPEKQARWIRRQMQLADRARAAAVFQLTFTDLSLSAFGQPANSILPLFIHLGLVDTAFKAKPSLAEWDRAFGRKLRD